MSILTIIIALALASPAAGEPVARCLADADAQAQECREQAWVAFWGDLRRMPVREVFERINEDLELCGLRREIRRGLCLDPEFDEGV